MSNWTPISLAKYCRYALGRDIRVVFKPYKELGHDALVHPQSQTLFYSDPHLPRWVVWHECGHLALTKMANINELVVPDYSPRLATSTKDFEFYGVRFEEHVQHERLAHLWAIQQARSRGMHKLFRELIDAINTNWDEIPVYREARRHLIQDLHRLGISI